jgi:hypothetical protein
MDGEISGPAERSDERTDMAYRYLQQAAEDPWKHRVHAKILL